MKPSAAAIEAAARAYYEDDHLDSVRHSDWGVPYSPAWEDVDPKHKPYWRGRVESIVAAVAPVIAEQAWAEGCQAGRRAWWPTNPYRKAGT